MYDLWDKEWQGKFKGKEVRLTFTVYAATRRKFDIANVCSIVDKFTCDALTHLGLWVDDNCDTIKQVIYQHGGVDKDNPRCELLIEEIV